MDKLHLTLIPTPADAEADQRNYAVTVDQTYIGWVESRPQQRRWAAYRANGALVSEQFATRREAAATLASAIGTAPNRAELDDCDQRRPHTSLYVTDSELAMLQELAASLGYYTRRGPHAKERGSVTALATALARAAADDTTYTLAALRRLFSGEKKGL